MDLLVRRMGKVCSKHRQPNRADATPLSTICPAALSLGDTRQSLANAAVAGGKAELSREVALVHGRLELKSTTNKVNAANRR